MRCIYDIQFLPIISIIHSSISSLLGYSHRDHKIHLAKTFIKMGQKVARSVADARPPGGIDSILKVSGTKIVDGQGREVVLKGVSLNFF